MMIVTSGGFDPLHTGHLNMLEAAYKISDWNVALVNTDEWLIRKKGKFFMPFTDRLRLVLALRVVADAFRAVDHDDTVVSSLAYLRQRYPDVEMVFANGGDRLSGNTPEEEWCKAHGVRCTYHVGGGKNVAAHTFGVIAVILELWPDASGELIRAAMHHDVVESLTGDTPAHAKWAFPKLEAAMHEAEHVLLAQHGLFEIDNTEDALRLKIADLVELCVTAHEQVMMGNENFYVVFERGVKYIQDNFGHHKDGYRALKFIETFVEQKGRAIHRS
jgi:D-beta-D-heptose 7-phosphate kinase/D-beta-D-heptose 1-phosphate adenosyltransferase